MATRRTTQELLAENKKRELEILRKEEERNAKHKAKLDTEIDALDKKIEDLVTKRDAKVEERDALDTTSTEVDEV